MTGALCITARELHTHRPCHIGRTSHRQSVNQNMDSPWCIACQDASKAHTVLVGIQNLQGSVTPHEFCTTACFVWSPLAPVPLFLIHLATDDDLRSGRKTQIQHCGTWLQYQLQATAYLALFSTFLRFLRGHSGVGSVWTTSGLVLACQYTCATVTSTNTYTTYIRSDKEGPVLTR